ncbi:acetyl-CoA decarbonylase/synthase complex subunit delta [Methanolinea mesophila]|uniref:acetyl-CoA decarbonylase/synthase complex subunit delta n=1 Tax=Methanolinea mesophila TaxID=547055 RepID=UPI001AE59721|nr:acetyl-CoA decarbonylase/synthase complex subunit delta [Methanolinea mesophila]MBP1928018.1 acetyl-CoA decarbonylase/synthase complex subunit delta [Methanolinea mesophila]
MTLPSLFEWNGRLNTVTIGATREEGGTRSVRYTIGGDDDLPFFSGTAGGSRPLVAFEICDDPELWSPIVRADEGDVMHDTGEWARHVEKDHRPDLIRLYLNSTRRRGFSDFSGIRRTVEAVLQATGLPLIIEGSIDPAIDSDVFQRCGEAAEGERVLLGTAEAGRYRSIAAAAMAYHHPLIAQSPIDINLAKQLNILLREIGVPPDRVVIDPYTGALGYGFEYSYSVMERIRFAALKGDGDLAMPMISAPVDTLNVREVRETPHGEQGQAAIKWEYCSALSAAVAGAAIVCVRHPGSVPLVKDSLAGLTGSTVTRRPEAQ